MKIIRIIAVFIFITNLNLYAQDYSMRRCMLLPITDIVNNAIGYKVYEKVEEYLRETDWCDYESNAQMLGVFSRYRDKLDSYLQDPKVLSTVSKNLQVGTLIRIDLKSEVDKIQLKLDVIGENGSDIYLSEKTVLDKPDVTITFNTIKNWLEIYEAAIPYDGRVNGILGDQVTFTVNNKENFIIGQEFLVKRLIRKKEHPLLQKIVAWESEKLAEGKIYNISDKQGLGIIKRYFGKSKLKKGDWIKLEKVAISKVIDDKKYPEMKNYEFGKLGEFDLTFDVSSSSVSTSSSSGNIKMDGYLFGISTDVEAWITRNYFAIGEFSKKLGVLEKSDGSPSLDKVNINSGHFKIGGGYKYLPMGFFYGPQVNLYGGYVSYSYNLEKSQSDGFGQTALSGFFIGIGGSLPLDRGIRLFAKGEIIPFTTFTDENNLFSSTKSSSSIYLKFGGLYEYNPKIKLIGALELNNNSSNFNSNTISQLSYKDTILKLGARITF